MSGETPPSRQDLTAGSIPGHLLRLAGPATLSAVLHNLYSMNDLVFAGFVDEGASAAQAAIGSCLFVAIFCFAFSQMATTGTLAIVSRLTGEKADRGRIGRQIGHGIVLVTMLGVLVAIVGFPLARPIMAFMSKGDPAVTDAGTTYLRGLFLGMPVIFLMSMVDALFRSRGTAVVPLLMEVMTVVVNLALNAVAVLVLHWGVLGIVLATVGSRVAGAGLGLVLIALGHLRLRVPLPRPDLGVYRRILSIGLPAGLRPMLFAAVFMGLLRIITEVGGIEAYGGVSVAIRIEGFCFLIMLGFGLAVAPLVGQNLGAGSSNRASRAAWTAAGFAGIAGFVIGALFFLIPEQLMGLLNRDDPALREMGADYLRIVAVCQIFTALEVTFGQAFLGAGNNVPPLVISTLFSVLRLPGAWLFGGVLGGGILAIWWVINLTAIFRGIGMWAWFLRGRWRTHRLPGHGPG